MRYIDLRSDTVTFPTDAMRDAMRNAEVGDDVYGDDPTVNRLEEMAAVKTGKEASLFVPSGTFGNQLAIMTHCNSASEVILDEDCHIVEHEAGAAALISRVQLRTVESANGIMTAEAVRKRIRKDEDIHFPKTGLVCMENARSSGVVVPLENMKAVYDTAKEYDIPVHVDGARFFNAAVALNVPVSEVGKYCDSVTFCLSKGLCAPIGSILAGSREFIEKARKNRKILGGGLRQAGVLAAPGILAITEMADRLKEDHENADFLRAELKKIDGIRVLDDGLQINMAFFDMSETGYDAVKFVDELYKRGVKINGADNGIVRFVTHYWIKREEIVTVINIMKELLAK